MSTENIWQISAISKGEFTMANYVCTNRTNYFRVTDAETFKNFLSQVVTDTDEDMYVWEKLGKPEYKPGCDY